MLRQCVSCPRKMRPWNTTIKEFPNTTKHGGRGLCEPCYRRDLYGPRKTWIGVELLAEVDALDGTPESIAQRLGTTVAAIAQAGYRHNRPDIGNEYNRVYRRRRKNG